MSISRESDWLVHVLVAIMLHDRDITACPHGLNYCFVTVCIVMNTDSILAILHHSGYKISELSLLK